MSSPADSFRPFSARAGHEWAWDSVRPTPPYTDAECNALWSYKNEGFRDVNEMLRRPEQFQVAKPDDYPIVSQRAELIAQAVAKVTLDRPVVVYRGCVNVELADWLLANIGVPQLQRAFTSTSFDQKIAWKGAFSVGTKFAPEPRGTVQMTLHVYPGVQVAYLELLRPKAFFDSGEAELLLQRGIILEVKQVSRQGNVTHALLEAYPDE